MDFKLSAYNQPDIPDLDEDERLVFVPLADSKELVTYILKRVYEDDKVPEDGRENVIIERIVDSVKPL